jgi:hypothetical protein
MTKGLDPITRVASSSSTTPFFYTDDYGITGVAHGDTPSDESTALLALLTTVYNAGGGTIEFNNRLYRFDSQWVIPNDGAATPKQPTMRIVGQGALFNGQGGPPNGGTILDLRFHGTPAKIDTRGLGLLDIGNLTLYDGGSADGTAFIQTTNTTLGIVGRLGFYGNTANTPTQDAIVLGGTTTVLGGAVDAPFQGYGTVIANCYFNRIRRWVYGRTYCNAVVIRDNTGWTQCGGDAAVEFDAGTDSNAGNTVIHNLCEINNYTYFLKTTGDFVHNTLGPNNCYDDTGTTTAIYRLQADAQYNFIRDGFRSDVVPLVSEVGSAIGTNSILTSHQSQPTLFAQPVNFTNETIKFANVSQQGPITQRTTGEQFLNQWINTTIVTFAYIPSGGSAEDIFFAQRASATDKRLQLQGSTNNVFSSVSDTRLQAADGSTIFIGTPSLPTQQIIGAAGTTFNSGVSGNGTGLKHVRQSTGSIAASTSVDVTVNLNGTAFADTNFTATATVVDSGANLRVVAIKSQTTSTVVVTVHNDDAGGAHTGSLSVIAIHD